MIVLYISVLFIHMPFANIFPLTIYCLSRYEEMELRSVAKIRRKAIACVSLSLSALVAIDILSRRGLGEVCSEKTFALKCKAGKTCYDVKLLYLLSVDLCR